MKPTNLLSRSKLAFIALAAFGLTALGMTSAADAAHPRKTRISNKTYNQMKRVNQRSVRRAFVSMDRNGDGVLTKRDFVKVTTTYKWKRIRRRWRRARVRKITVSKKWRQLVRNPYLNDRVITYRAYRTVMAASFERRIAQKYIIVRPRSHRHARLAPKKPKAWY